MIKQKDAYRLWLSLYHNFPKIERFGIGKKIESNFLDILELTFSSFYLDPAQKVTLLGKAISKLDNTKFFMQVAWEHDLIKTEKYALITKDLEEIGRMLYGWRKGLQQKLPPKT